MYSLLGNIPNMPQIDLHGRAILPRAQLLEVLVQRVFEATYRVPAPGAALLPPAEGMHSVLVNAQLGPALRISYLVDQTIEERLSLSHRGIDFGTLTVHLMDDLETNHSTKVDMTTTRLIYTIILNDVWI